MSSRDDQTLGFYRDEARAYATRTRAVAYDRLNGFLASLPPRGSILELGCGGGHDTVALIAAGFAVTPTDGSADIAREAERRLGRPVGVLLFDEIDDEGVYDGVWANACLLHVPRVGLRPIIARIHRALKAGGVFYGSYKAGTAEGYDQFGRYFNYPSADWLRATYGVSSWSRLTIEEATGGGYDQKPTTWLHVTAVKGI